MYDVSSTLIWKPGVLACDVTFVCLPHQLFLKPIHINSISQPRGSGGMELGSLFTSPRECDHWWNNI